MLEFYKRLGRAAPAAALWEAQNELRQLSRAEIAERYRRLGGTPEVQIRRGSARRRIDLDPDFEELPDLDSSLDGSATTVWAGFILVGSPRMVVVVRNNTVRWPSSRVGVLVDRESAYLTRLALLRVLIRNRSRLSKCT